MSITEDFERHFGECERQRRETTTTKVMADICSATKTAPTRRSL